MTNKLILLTALLLPFCLPANAQTKDADKYLVYKKTAKRDLGISLYLPSTKQEKFPLVIFFHGGGWNNGAPDQFTARAVYLRAKGIASALVAYRLKDTDKTDPFTALADAKSAVRYLKQHADEEHIDTNKIVLSGGSAGGHLAAACQWVNGFNDANDELSISTKGMALILFNPVIDNGPKGYGYERIKDKYLQFSPFHQNKKGNVQVLVMSGTADTLVAVDMLKKFKKQVNRSGGHCKLVLYKDAGHGFFNRPPYYQKTVTEIDDFLIRIGILKKYL